jgi:hypothetical protein
LPRSFFYALAKRRAPQATRPRPLLVGFGIAAWLVALWLLMGGDPIRERLIVAALRDDTQSGAAGSPVLGL